MKFYSLRCAHELLSRKIYKPKRLQLVGLESFWLNALFISTVSNVNKDANQHPAD